MESWFRDSVMKFQPGADVNIFISQLENGYKLCVTPKNKLEHSFVKLAVNKLCSEYSNSFLTSNAEISTFAAFKKYLKDNYSTRETVFQVLAHMWDIERKPNEDIHSLGVRYQEKAADISTRITAMYEEKVKSEATPDKKMSAADFCMLVGAMQLFQHIRSKEPDTYRLLIRECDDCFTPADLSRKAKLYADRLDKSDPIAHGETYAARNQPSSSRTSSRSNYDSLCYEYRDHGKCKRGEECPYLHDPRRKKPANDNEPRKSNRGGRYRRHGSKSNKNPNTTNQGNTANVNQAQKADDRGSTTEVGQEVFRLP